MSTGDWNASHYKNAEFDSVAKTYLEASELRPSGSATKRMAGLLLRDTPVITDYFINYVTASYRRRSGTTSPRESRTIRLAKVGLA